MRKNIFFMAGCVLFLAAALSSAQTAPFPGEIKADNTNIRVDSTVSSQSISVLNKGDRVEVISESYQWYKIRLPKNAPAYIKKSLVLPLSKNTAEVEKTNVNIRLGPEGKSPVIGKANKGELLNIAGAEGAWYKVEPPEKSFGWIHSRFVRKAPAEPQAAPEPIKEEKKEEINKAGAGSFEGIVKPYGRVFRRIATQKLITTDKKIFLLKGEKSLLNGLNYRRARVEGNLIEYEKEKYPVIEVTNAEVLE